VNRKHEKHIAEEIAASVSGVKEVSNRIRVQDGGERERGGGRY
jgi:osmotically-inducible protein OsmY